MDAMKRPAHRPPLPKGEARTLRALRCHPSTWRTLDAAAKVRKLNVGRLLDEIARQLTIS